MSGRKRMGQVRQFVGKGWLGYVGKTQVVTHYECGCQVAEDGYDVFTCKEHALTAKNPET